MSFKNSNFCEQKSAMEVIKYLQITYVVRILVKTIASSVLICKFAKIWTANIKTRNIYPVYGTSTGHLATFLSYDLAVIKRWPSDKLIIFVRFVNSLLIKINSIHKSSSKS